MTRPNKTANEYILILIASIFLLALPNSLIASPQNAEELKNGSFEDWKDGLPTGWTVEPGIFNGSDSPLSKVQKSNDGGIEIFGNKKTLAWNIVGQDAPLKADRVYLLKFEAKTKNLKREVNQHDNCHVGFWFQNAKGQTVGNKLEFVEAKKYTEYTVSAKLPEGATKAKIYLTLSKTGRLYVKNIKLKELSATDSFDFLVDSMKAKYSYFEHKKIDFEELAKKYRHKAISAKDKEEFTEVAANMLAELKDGHTWIIRDGKRYTKFRSYSKPNCNFAYINKELKNSVSIGNFALVGKTKEGLGYLRINSLFQIENENARKLHTEVQKVLDSPAIIVDLRGNGGGAEPLAQAIAGMFADQEYVYAKQKFRSGTGFGKVQSRILKPTARKPYTKPIACLIGPGAVSSGEGFAMMMKALNHCETIGQPTRGSSGNPAPVTLPNGVEVWFSRWVAMEADGTPIEDRGVTPDIKVEHDTQKNNDPTFIKAIEILKEKVKN